MSVVSRSPSATMISTLVRTWSTARCARGSSCGTSGNTRSSRRFRMILAKPTTDVSGVRSSWLTLVRKALLASFAATAASFACCISSNRREFSTALAIWPGDGLREGDLVRRELAARLVGSDHERPDDRATRQQGHDHEALGAAGRGGAPWSGRSTGRSWALLTTSDLAARR